jgi:ATP-dependent DNA ligase
VRVIHVFHLSNKSNKINNFKQFQTISTMSEARVEFTKLYKLTTTRAVQTWAIEVKARDPNSEATTIVEFGQLGGKMQVQSSITTIGKNIAKTNETSPYEQAVAEAKSKWNDKIQSGYTSVQDKVRPAGGPMLAECYDKKHHKIIWPAFSQPKLDGIRCLAYLNGGVKFMSRTGHAIDTMDHIKNELMIMNLQRAITTRPILEAIEALDGELYLDDVEFDAIASAVANKTGRTAQIDPTFIEYHVYDFIPVDVTMPFSARLNILNDLRMYICQMNLKSHIKIVTTKIVHNQIELDLEVKTHVKQGYEGTMVRNDSVYLHCRTTNLQKIKSMPDSEFVVVGFEEGKGKLANHIGSYTCTTKSGNVFKVKKDGQPEPISSGSSRIGKLLTVAYQSKTANGVLRFPIGKTFRDYE